MLPEDVDIISSDDENILLMLPSNERKEFRKALRKEIREREMIQKLKVRAQNVSLRTTQTIYRRVKRTPTVNPSVTRNLKTILRRNLKRKLKRSLECYMKKNRRV